MDNNIKALKSGLWYVISNFLVKGIAFLTTPIFSRLVTKSDFGIYSNYTSWLSLMMIFVTLNLESTLISARFDFEKKFDEYILSMLSLTVLCSTIWIFVCNAFPRFFEQLFNLNSIYINIIFIHSMFLSIINMYQARQRYLFEYKKSVLVGIVLSISTAFLSIALVVFMQNKLVGRIIGSSIPTILIGTVVFFYFLSKGKKIRLIYWKYAIPICLPYIPHLLSMTVLNSTDKIMITKFCGTEETALYSLAYTCGMIVTLLSSSVNSAFAPWFGEKLHEGKITEIKAISKKYIFVFFVFSIGILLTSPEILLILGGKSYYEAVYVLAPVSMGCVCQFLYTLFVNLEQFKKKTKGMAYASTLAAVINLGLNYLLIPRIGYLAAAYTTLIGYICLLLMHMYFVKKLNLDNVYSYKFILSTVAVGIVAMITILLLYSTNALRYIIIIVYFAFLGAMLYRNKNVIINLFKRKEVNHV